MWPRGFNSVNIIFPLFLLGDAGVPGAPGIPGGGKGTPYEGMPTYEGISACTYYVNCHTRPNA